MWDAVYGWLLAYLPTLTGLKDVVFDGTPLTQNQLLGYASLGDEDPSGFAEEDATEPIDTLLGENGEIVVKFVSRSGDADLAPHRVSTKAWVDALRAHLKSDQTLGGLLTQGSWVTAGRMETRQQKTPGGVRVERAVTVRYFTRL